MNTWERKADTDSRHTAATMYEKDGFRVWKGKRKIYSVIYSADKWHLERITDHEVLYSAGTAKECREAYDNAVARKVDVNTAAFIY